MLYESTNTLLQSILVGLETGDESRWEDNVESGNACLFEMHQMSRPLYRAYRTDSLKASSARQSDIHGRLSRAIPHVRSMVIAIRHRDRARALESGNCALVEMYGARTLPPASPAVRPKLEARSAPEAQHLHAKVAERHRLTLVGGKLPSPTRVAVRNGRPQ